MQCQADWESDWERAPWGMNFPKFPVGQHTGRREQDAVERNTRQLPWVAVATRQQGYTIAGQSVPPNMDPAQANVPY